MTRMLKYPIPADQDQTTIAIRAGATIRAIGVQRPREICLWAEVPNDGEIVTRTFRVVPTGIAVPGGWTYVGTAFDGPFVWHVYEAT